MVFWHVLANKKWKSMLDMCQITYNPFCSCGPDGGCQFQIQTWASRSELENKCVQSKGIKNQERKQGLLFCVRNVLGNWTYWNCLLQRVVVWDNVRDVNILIGIWISCFSCRYLACWTSWESWEFVLPLSISFAVGMSLSADHCSKYFTVLLKKEKNIAICNYSLQITACNRLLLNKDTLTIFWVLN